MPCVDNKDLIYNIKELPETFSIGIGDLLLVETDEGTNIMDFNNFVIGLDNTTFGTTITQHSTDIASLSSEIDSLSATVEDKVATAVGATTKALLTLSTSDSGGPSIVSNTNITSVEWENNETVLRFNFEDNFPNAAYMVLPSAPVTNSSNELVQLVVAEKQTNYLDMSAVNILDGTLALSAEGIGFQIQTF